MKFLENLELFKFVALFNHKPNRLMNFPSFRKFLFFFFAYTNRSEVRKFYKLASPVVGFSQETKRNETHRSRIKHEYVARSARSSLTPLSVDISSRSARETRRER